MKKANAPDAMRFNPYVRNAVVLRPAINAFLHTFQAKMESVNYAREMLITASNAKVLQSVQSASHSNTIPTPKGNVSFALTLILIA